MITERERAMWNKYPYNVGTFCRNLKQYGLEDSLKHDRDRTREHIESGFVFAVGTIFYAALMAMAVPIVIYDACKALRESSKKEKEIRADYKEK